LPFEVLENPIRVENRAIFPVPHEDVGFPGLKKIECSIDNAKEANNGDSGTELQVEMVRLHEEARAIERR